MGSAGSDLSPDTPISKEEQAKLNRKREAIAREILTTEQTYVKLLKVLCWSWRQPLVEATNSGKSIVKYEEVKTIFSIAPDILTIHQKILEGIEGRLANWTEEQKIADIFLDNADTLKYYTEYVNNYNEALTCLARIQHKTKVQKYLKEKHKFPESENYSLSDFLILPIQRIPRYQLLLQELLKSTRKKHPDFKHLSAALTAVMQVASYINEQKKHYEETQLVYALQEKFVGKFDLVAPHRKIVKDGDMSEAKTKHLFHWILFCDVLALTTYEGKKNNKFNVHALSPLLNIEVRAEDPLYLHIDISLGKKEKTWSFLFESKAARDAWILDFIEIKSQAKPLKAQTMKYLPDKRKPVEENMSPRQKEKLEKQQTDKEEKERKEKERAEKEKKEREEKERKDREKEKEKEKKDKDKRGTKDTGVAEGLRRQSVGAWNALKSMINNDKT
eukprot:TRINITY_DN118_c1_g1_i2.p1 TRINITY_DN118_c1_g1~~TRINITY_DN118_c1_g1_i2.p1  ORF type:complete len:446 (-),score=91.32 TRINITY_DN118_c1_g1_i2:217-1554(-)